MEYDNEKLIDYFKSSRIEDDWLIVEDGSSFEIELQHELNKKYFYTEDLLR